MTVKPDPITDATNGIADALKKSPKSTGGIFRDAAGKNTPVVGDARGVADAINKGGLTPKEQDSVWDRYNQRTDRTHDVFRRSADGGQEISISPKKAAKVEPVQEPLGYII